jgi:selenocysteine lyase/cysteine desulfurase
VQALAKQKISVAARGKGIRVSLHMFNNEADVTAFVVALGALRPK